MDDEKVNVTKLYADALQTIANQRQSNDDTQEKMCQLIAWRVGVIELLRTVATRWEANADAATRQCGHDLRDIANSVIRGPHNIDEIMDAAFAEKTID